MSQTTLIATPRTGSGTPTARRLRAEGHIPGVLYGRGMEPDQRHASSAASSAWPSAARPAPTPCWPSQVGGNSYPAVVKEMQRHPIRRTVSHIDFLQVNMNEEITVHVRVRLEGEAKAVAADGRPGRRRRRLARGQLHPHRHAQRVRHRHHRHAARHVIRLSDIPMPKGVTALGDPDMAVVTVLTTAAEIEEPVAEADEGEGEAEGGEAPAADGDAAAVRHRVI